MNYKKMFGIIFVVIIAMFGVMLTTSYAWYSFTNTSTSFDAVTSNEDVEITFIKGEYINTTTAIPISSDEIDKYSEKHQFSVRTKNNTSNNEILVTVSLIEITMSGSLQTSDFYIELYHQGSSVNTVQGAVGGVPKIPREGSVELGSVVLDNDLDNQFEVRVYIKDNGGDQYDLMGKSLQAKIKVDVVSRLKPVLTTWDDPDIYVSSITIDGESSTTLPTDGYYTMTSTCTKGSNLTWDGYSKTITYNSGSYINDNCSLTFTSATSTKLLNTVEVGSYVEYVGTNGCSGKSCMGQNANYKNDDNMGYCNSSSYKFTVNGWRVAYIKDGNVHLISAGAPECVRTYVVNKSTSTSNQTLSTNYYYGSGYSFNENTGYYSLTGVTSTTLAWSSNYEAIIANTPYTCKSTSSTGTCTTLYEVAEYSSSTVGKAYIYYNYSANPDNDHIPHLNKVALTYCNPKYARGGVCDENTSWAMNNDDYNTMLGKTLSSCSGYSSNKSCGYTNDLIDNGGYYWFAKRYSTSSNISFSWSPNYRYVGDNDSGNLFGLRPVLSLESSVSVVGGSGTYKDPYKIAI